MGLSAFGPQARLDAVDGRAAQAFGPRSAREPSLARFPAEIFSEVYGLARFDAVRETGLDLTVFPEAPPFALIQVLDEGYLPDVPNPLEA